MHAAQTALLPPLAGIAASQLAGRGADYLISSGMPLSDVRKVSPPHASSPLCQMSCARSHGDGLQIKLCHAAVLHSTVPNYAHALFNSCDIDSPTGHAVRRVFGTRGAAHSAVAQWRHRLIRNCNGCVCHGRAWDEQLQPCGALLHTSGEGAVCGCVGG